MSSAATTRKQHRTVGGYVWFAFMVGGWTAFFALLLLSQSTLTDIWRDLRSLPLIVEALVWFALFPLLLATAVWSSAASACRRRQKFDGSCPRDRSRTFVAG